MLLFVMLCFTQVTFPLFFQTSLVHPPFYLQPLFVLATFHFSFSYFQFMCQYSLILATNSHWSLRAPANCWTSETIGCSAGKRRRVILWAKHLNIPVLFILLWTTWEEEGRKNIQKLYMVWKNGRIRNRKRITWSQHLILVMLYFYP